MGPRCIQSMYCGMPQAEAMHRVHNSGKPLALIKLCVSAKSFIKKKSLHLNLNSLTTFLHSEETILDLF